MLTSLYIENFAIVSKLELDFDGGMTAFTGETGAGKSIMIDALMLALGGRGDATVIRPAASKCEITASFHIDEDSEPHRWLIEHEADAGDGSVLLRRVITADGRSKAFINGQAHTLQKVKELSELMVDIHGQHQHQRLLQHATHREQLDAFANHKDELLALAVLYKQHQQSLERLSTLKAQGAAHERKALLEFQIEELSDLGLEEGEVDALNQEHQLLHHAKDYLIETQLVRDLLGSDDSPNVCALLNQALQALTNLPSENPKLRVVSELLNNALIHSEEALAEIVHFAEGIELNPERLLEVEERLSRLHHLARKYQVDVKALPLHLKALSTELQTLESMKSLESTLEVELNKQYQAYQEKALALRASRLKHAKGLSEQITKTMRQLGMPQGIIELEFTPLDKMQAHGLDKIEYKVCTNPGMKPDSLSKIASGGELSRISLAIQMIAAERGSTPTLLFDEVDVGIGGSTAALVGQLLRNLGERLQLFCVTHQPQVAASAHHHFLVEKTTAQGQTFSKITALDKSQKIDEISRMLGGLTITEQTRSHAKELLGA